MRGVGPHASWKICDLQSSSLFLSLLLLLLLDVELSSTKGAPTQNSFNTSLIRNITKVLIFFHCFRLIPGLKNIQHPLFILKHFMKGISTPNNEEHFKFFPNYSYNEIIQDNFSVVR